MKKLVLCAIVAAVVAANVLVVRSSLRAGTDAGAEDPLWALLAQAKVPDRPDLDPVLPDALRSMDGKRVTLPGVVFQMKAGVADGRVQWCVLMPPSRYGCCGITCDPKPEMSVYVDCARAPFAASSQAQRMATVEGTLRLGRGAGSWCLTTLEDAVVRPAGGAAPAPE